MRKHRYSVRAGFAVLIAPLFLGTSITAQSQSLEEITVTARKTEENLQEVPLAVTALGAEQIDRLGVRDLASLSQQDTSVQFDEGFTPSDTRITIRGLSPTRGRPNAATLIDGVDITSEAVSNAGGSLLIDPRLIDVQRIEIVKGPQSALYGRSAFAGAISYVTKDPADVLSGGVFADYNLEGSQELRGNVSVPVSDTFGARLNGLAWNQDGYYRNAATGQKLGGGKGVGGTLTLKWEPTDNVSAKWRTDYTDDQFDVAAQKLLNDRNKFYDLGNTAGISPKRSNLAPLSGQREFDPMMDPGPAIPSGMYMGVGTPVDRAGCVNGAAQAAAGMTPNGGFLDNYGCGDGKVFNDFLMNPGQDPNYAANNPPGTGNYDPTDVWNRNVYNKQLISVYTGKMPDAKGLLPSIQPDYRKTNNPYNAVDFEGSDRTVFRNSLVIDWDINDTLRFNSLTSYTDAEENTATDIGKYFVDNCSPDPNDPRAPEFRAQSDCSRGDGIHDGGISFFQDSSNSTQQFSQEFRLAWNITDAFTFTQGLQYWRERVEQSQLNATTIVSGPVCYLGEFGNNPGNISDSAINAVGGFLGLTPAKNQCGNSALSSAYWADDVNQARIPSLITRSTDHYSWYGQLQWNVTDKFRSTFEARYTIEDNEASGPVQHRCLVGLADEFLSDTARFRDSVTGRELCQGFTTDLTDPMNPVYRNITGSESAATTGPGSAVVCGQTGRCDNLDQAPGNSWWDYGFSGQSGWAATLNRRDRYWAPKATLEYFWTDDIMTYFSWSRGIKPGGFSLLTLGAFGVDANNDGDFSEVEFEPERLDVWEIGAKTTLFDNRLRLNGSVFYQDFKDKQVTVQAVVGETIGTRVENISGSEVRGLELDATLQATDELRLTVGYTFLDSEYTDYTILTTSPNDIGRIQLGNGKGCTALGTFDDGSIGCVASFNGNELERVPRHAFLVNANYTNNLFETGLEWFGEVNYRYQDERWLEAFNIVKFPAYSRTNLSLGLIGDTWDLQLYVTNVFDDTTVISGGANPGIPTGSFGFGFESVNGLVPPGINAGPKLPSDVYINLPDPRIIGARVNFRFGE